LLLQAAVCRMIQLFFFTIYFTFHKLAQEAIC